MAVVGGLTHSCLARLIKTNSHIPHDTQKVSSCTNHFQCRWNHTMAVLRGAGAKPILVCLMANAHYKIQTYRPTDNA